MIILVNLRIVFKFKDCKLQFYEKRRLFSYFIVKPRTPASRWRRLLNLKRININSFKIIIGFFFTPPLFLATKAAISFVYCYTTYYFRCNRWPTADQLVFFVLPWVNIVLPWVNFVLPWVKFVVPWLFVLPWQLWATTVVGHCTDPLIIKAVRVLFTSRRCVTAESYISDFSHSSVPPYLCVGRFSVYSKLASAEGAEGMQMLESMFTGWEVNVN